jgi:hypothetical protein
MASIVVHFDTVTKEMSVAIDGKSVDNVRGIDIYPSWDDPDAYRCAISTLAEDEDNDMKTMTTLIASQTPRAQAGIAEETAMPSDAYEGFVQANETAPFTLGDDVLSFFGK